MTLAYMVSLVYGSFGFRFQCSPLDVLYALDSAQKAAFAKDCRAFIRDGVLGEGGSLPDDCREVIDCGGAVDLFSRKADGEAGTPLQYYIRPPSLTANGGLTLDNLELLGTEQSQLNGDDLPFYETDEKTVIVPQEWRRQVLVEPAIALLDAGLYGDKATQANLDGFFREWWQAMDARPRDRKPIDSAGAW